MKTQKFALLIAIFSLFTLASCDKDKDPKAKSKADLLSSSAGKKWKTTSIIEKYTGGGRTVEDDVFTDMDDCNKDDVTILFANKKAELREGATKCNTNDSDLISEGTWTLNSDETLLTVVAGTSALNYTIKELTASKLVVEYKETDSGITYTYTETYTAQ